MRAETQSPNPQKNPAPAARTGRIILPCLLRGAIPAEHVHSRGWGWFPHGKPEASHRQACLGHVPRPLRLNSELTRNTGSADMFDASKSPRNESGVAQAAAERRR